MKYFEIARCNFLTGALYLYCNNITNDLDVCDMRVLRIFFKILLFPVSLVLTIFVAISSFLIERAAVLLNIVSGILFLAALAAYAEYFFGWPFDRIGDAPTLQLAIFGTVFAFVLSPYGLPTFTLWLVDKLDDLNCAIKSI